MSNTWNTRNSKEHHAENYLILENAQYLRKYGMECIIYTTLEPCLMCIIIIFMADIRNIIVGFEDRYMQTRRFINSNDWLKDRVNNYLVGIMETEYKDLIIRYGEESDKSILLKKSAFIHQITMRSHLLTY